MYTGYKYRLYPTPEQMILLNKHFGCNRWVYNHMLDRKMKAYEKDKTNLSRFDLQKELPVLKKEKETEWLKEVNSQSLQIAVMHVDVAYKNFYRTNKGFPNFKKKHEKQSYTCSQGTDINWENKTVSIIKIKDIPVTLSRKFEGTIKSVTLSKTPTNQYYISVLVDEPKKVPLKKQITVESTVGIDAGIKTLLTLSDGTTFENNRFLKRNLDKLKKLQSKGVNKKKGSNNKKKHNLKIARIYGRITNQRTDYLHKITHELTKSGENQSGYSCIVIEDLNIKGMSATPKPKKDEATGTFLPNGASQKSGLNQALLDASLGAFFTMLEYKCERRGVTLLKIGRFDPSSKTCSDCNEINAELTLSDRTWTCRCGKKHDRDLNAAINIKNFGLKQLKETQDKQFEVLTTGGAPSNTPDRNQETNQPKCHQDYKG